jgi:hypothetical protein
VKLLKLLNPPESTYDEPVEPETIREQVVAEGRTDDDFADHEREVVEVVTEQLCEFYNSELAVSKYHAYSLFALVAGAILGIVGIATIANGFITTLPESPVSSPLIDAGATFLLLAMVAFYAFIGLQMRSTRSVSDQMQAVLIAHPVVTSEAAADVVSDEIKEFITETDVAGESTDALAGLSDRLNYASEMHQFTEQLNVMESRHAQQRHLAVFALVCAALFQGSLLLL